MQSLKSYFFQNKIVNHTIIPINETAINQSFEPVNNLFEEFQIFSSNLFSQIMDWIYPMLKNLAN